MNVKPRYKFLCRLTTDIYAFLRYPIGLDSEVEYIPVEWFWGYDPIPK